MSTLAFDKTEHLTILRLPRQEVGRKLGLQIGGV